MRRLTIAPRAALDHVEDGIAAARAGVQLDERVGDQDLAILGPRRGRCEEHQQASSASSTMNSIN